MTDTPDAPQSSGNGAAAQAATPKVTNRVVTQYIKDISFENVLAQKGASGEVTPEISVQVNLDARKRGASEHQYEVITKLTITSKAKGTDTTLFLMELEYAGVFHIEGVPQEQLHPYLLIECPRITFPFLRRIVSDMTRDGGFPPLNLEMIDFLQLYRAEIAKRTQARQGTEEGGSGSGGGTTTMGEA